MVNCPEPPSPAHGCGRRGTTANVNLPPEFESWSGPRMVADVVHPRKLTWNLINSFWRPTRKVGIANTRVIGRTVRCRTFWGVQNRARFYHFLPKACSEGGPAAKAIRTSAGRRLAGKPQQAEGRPKTGQLGAFGGRPIGVKPTQSQRG